MWSKSIQCNLLLHENHLPMKMLEKLYDTVVQRNDKKHVRFLTLAQEYFGSFYPHHHSSERKFKRGKWEKSLHFTNLVRNSYLPNKPSNDERLEKVVLRTATKLNEAGISFEKIEDRCLLNMKFEKKRFFNWFLCLGCLPCYKLFKARFQVPQLKVDHPTECVLRNTKDFEQCHYPEEPYM
ncbi:hypothetical protein VNO77_14971 [Canavalia gladiata]|uniref:Uncharacterized protein n=1 Tax=Canavalia gladiata TaxID=3824 RepID=A0AAN9LZT7_CANGL